MSNLYKCKTVTEIKTGTYGPYRGVETVCGKSFLCSVDEGVDKLAPGMEFTCDLNSKIVGDKTRYSVAKGSFAVKPQTGPTEALPPAKPDFRTHTQKDDDGQKRGNALTNLTSLANGGLLTQDEIDRLKLVLLTNAGILG